MPKVGDRVVVEGSKVGGGRREGTLTQVVGSLLKVRWVDGGETLMAPAAGSIQFLPGTSKSVGGHKGATSSGGKGDKKGKKSSDGGKKGKKKK